MINENEPSQYWIEFIKTLSAFELVKLRNDFKKHPLDSDKRWLEEIDKEMRERERRSR